MSRLAKITLTSLCRMIIQATILLLLALVGVDLLFQDAGFSESYAWLVTWVPLGSLGMVPLLVLGGLCLFLPVAYLLVSWISCRLERGIVGKGSDGENIALAPEAVERAIIREIRDQVPEVLKVRCCQALQGSKGAKVSLQIVISDRCPVPEVRAKAKEVVSGVLTQLVGFSDGSDVKVKVRELVSAKRTTDTAKARPQRSKGGNGRPTPKPEKVEKASADVEEI